MEENSGELHKSNKHEAGLNGLNRERMARSEHGRVVVSSKK